MGLVDMDGDQPKNSISMHDLSNAYIIKPGRTAVRLPLLIALLLALSCGDAFAQNPTANTLALAPGASSPEATLQQVAWIRGHWRGEALGGIAEEWWSPPLGNAMMCTFRLVVDGQVRFYEIVTIMEKEQSLLMRLKHFDGELHGWEERDETVDFPLVKISRDRVYFSGLTFERAGPDSLTVYVDTDGQQELTFRYGRVGN